MYTIITVFLIIAICIVPVAFCSENDKKNNKK